MKHIRMSYIEVPEYNVVVAKIEEQTHKEKSFGITDEFFVADNGVVIYSHTFPAFSNKSGSGAPTLYCRGSDSDEDSNLFLIPMKYFDEIKAAIKDYNEVFGELDEKEEGLKYIG